MSLRCKLLERKCYLQTTVHLHISRRAAAHLALEAHRRITATALALLGEEAELALLGDVA